MWSHPNMNSARTISDLPVEILPMIFKNLSTKDRKAVKLVCQLWFEICNNLPLTNDEVLNCLGIYQLPDIYEFLNRSERRFLNLKFDFVKFDECSSFWINNASRIRSIAFKDCRFAEGVDEIIICCENLFHLSFTYTSPPLLYRRRYYRRFNPLSFLNFEGLIERGVIRENLNSLKIDVRSRTLINLSDYTMSQLFTVFPQLKILKIIYYDYGSFNDFGSENSRGARNYTDFTFAPVLSYLVAAKDRLEKLKLHFPLARCSTKEMRTILETLVAMTKLKELSINLGTTLEPQNIETFLIFRPLKSLLYSRWSYREPVSLQTFLSNSSLEHLEVGVPIDSSVTTKTFYDMLLSSSLRSSKIVIKDGILMDDPNSFDSGFLDKTRLTTLPRLSVRISRHIPGQTRDMTQFLQYFQNLRHLLIDDISYDELQSLLQYQTKLKSLVLKEEGQLKNLSQDRVDIFKNAFSQLTELEHLELSSSAAFIFLRSLLPGSVLTNLRYLKISLSIYVNNMIFPSDLLKLVDATPFLEGLYVYDTGNITFAVCLMLCSKLSRLRFLRWDKCQVNDPFCTDELFHKLFSMCPSLRLLFYTSTFQYIYFLDTINQKVVRVLQNDAANEPYTFAKPRIGGYTVDWLTFPKKISCENKRFF